MEIKVNFRIGEDDKFFYVFNENGNLLNSYSKEYIKTISELKEKLKHNVDIVNKSILDTIREAIYMKVINQAMYKEYKISKGLRNNSIDFKMSKNTSDKLRKEQNEHYLKWKFLKGLSEAMDKIEVK